MAAAAEQVPAMTKAMKTWFQISGDSQTIMLATPHSDADAVEPTMKYRPHFSMSLPGSRRRNARPSR